MMGGLDLCGLDSVSGLSLFTLSASQSDICVWGQWFHKLPNEGRTATLS